MSRQRRKTIVTFLRPTGTAYEGTVEDAACIIDSGAGELVSKSPVIVRLSDLGTRRMMVPSETKLVPFPCLGELLPLSAKNYRTGKTRGHRSISRAEAEFQRYKRLQEERASEAALLLARERELIAARSRKSAVKPKPLRTVSKKRLDRLAVGA